MSLLWICKNHFSTGDFTYFKHNIKCPDFHLIFSCRTPYLFPSVAGWRPAGLSDEDSARQQSWNTVGRTICRYKILLLGYPSIWSLDWLYKMYHSSSVSLTARRLCTGFPSCPQNAPQIPNILARISPLLSSHLIPLTASPPTLSPPMKSFLFPFPWRFLCPPLQLSLLLSFL